MAGVDANPRLSIGYALSNSATPQTYMDAQQAQLMAQQLQDATTAGQAPIGIGSALANGLAAWNDRRKLAAADAKLIGEGQAGQLATIGTLAGNIGLGGQPSPQALGAALSGQQPAGAPPGAAGAPPAAPQAAPLAGAPQGAMPANAPVPPPPAQAAQGPPQGFPGAADPAASAAPRVGPPITPQDRDALIRMVYGEARGEHPAGQAATAAVALNRSILSGQPVAQIVGAPGQFEGMKVGANLDPHSPEYAQIARVVDPLLTGQLADPSGGATHFYAPAAQAALGRGRPPWDDGSGRMIGRQVFFNLPFGAHGSGLPPGSYQVAQNGAPGPMPSAAAAQLGAPPSGAPATGGGQMQPPQIAYGNGPTQQERQTILSYLASPNPALRQQAMEMMQSISTRMRSPIDYEAHFDASTGRTVYTPKTPGQGPVQQADAPAGYAPPAPKDMGLGSDGQYHPLPGTMVSAPQKAGPTGTVQYDPFGKATYATIPGAADQWGAPQKIAGADGLYQRNAVTGEIRKAADANFSTSDVGKQLTELYGSPEMDRMHKTGEMYRSLVSAAGRPGGVPDAELIDNAAQLFSGGVARQFNQKMLDEAQGPLARLRQFAPQILSGQHLSPEARQAIIQASHDYATEAQRAFTQREASAQAFAQHNGQDLTPYLQPFQNPLPDIPNLSTIPSGIGGVQSGNGQLGQRPGGGMGSGGAGGVPGPSGRLSPAQASALPPGTRFQGMDGVWRVRH